jgi:hypothetical protein
MNKQWIGTVERVAPPIPSRPHRVIRFVGLRDPLVPVAAVSTGSVEIIEEHKRIGQPVLVRGDVVAEHDERGVAISLFHVAEDLIVRAVLFHHVDHMLDERRLSGAPWNGHRRHVGCRGGFSRGRPGERKRLFSATAVL